MMPSNRTMLQYCFATVVVLAFTAGQAFAWTAGGLAVAAVSVAALARVEERERLAPLVVGVVIVAVVAVAYEAVRMGSV